ncbi:MAG TPA: cyclic nucleotide-binding domain-containing protein [Thermoanaerobaculia bacterium]|nr:cyclic nucleotide-binding domain-containing protein [Thermoanaerobaculia bacterium]
MSTLDRLAQTQVFSHFQRPQLEALAALTEERTVPAESFVLRQGDDSNLDAFLIDRGSVRIQRSTPYGNYALAVLASGDLFGEASFVDSSARSGDAWTGSECGLLAFRPERLLPELDDDPRLATAFYWTCWRSLSTKLRKTNDKLTRFFAQGSAEVRAVVTGEKPPPVDFRVDLRTKRDLFTEQKLSGLEINLLSSLSKEHKLRPGEVLFREGDPGDAMYVVLDGRVRISKHIPGAGEEALAILERGDYFGEMALIDQMPRSAEAKAHERGAVVLAIPQIVVGQLLDRRKVSSVRLLRILCSLVAQRLREIDDKLVTWYILAGGDVPEVR